jgi:hypothetical protein
MTVRAKFRCESVKQIVNSEGKIAQVDVDLRAVVNNSEDNKSWSKWTPAGCLTMMVTNPECFDKFCPGQAYFIDITAAE